MQKSAKSAGIRKLLKQGYTVSQIQDHMAVSGSYIHAIKKQMEASMEAEVEKPAKITTLSMDKTVFSNLTDKPGEFIQTSTNNVDAILDARADNYGPFIRQATIAQLFKATMATHLQTTNKAIMSDQAEALDMIFTKIGRILNGDPNHLDSWVDIAGYATLVADRLKGKVR